MPRRRSVLVIDDHPLFRKGVVQLLQSRDDYEVAGEAPSGAEGIDLARRLRPDCILLDLNLKDMSGIDVLKSLKAHDAGACVLMLTVSDAAEDLVDALRGGADGYLLKDADPQELLSGLHAAAQGRVAVSSLLTGILAQALRGDALPRTPAEAGLTAQERAILEHVADGQSNKVIARELGISEGTVKVHVKHLLKKLRLRSRVEAAVWAVEHGYRPNPTHNGSRR
ncbi:MAG: two-component system response regulator NarL [Pseudomonadota bacterium]|uniref:two-component system response regulator NarL n=1 Tax=Thermithiobacillus tepidarius TaxID=929 RepID=UPI000571F5F7|nr:two-component system response regulator NarL [Thermithiobacillus tepidarius]